MDHMISNHSLFVFLFFILFQYRAHTQIAWSDTLSAVIVSALKTELKVSQSAKQVLIIDHATIDRHRGMSFSQLLSSVAGISINGVLSNPSKDQSLYLRGAKNDYTVLLVDGVPIQDPSGIGGAIDLRVFNVQQIERIEILKGAQTSLYGSDAIAGVINIITRASPQKGWSSTMNVSGGNLSSYDAYGKLDYNLAAFHIGLDLGMNHAGGLSEAIDTSLNKSYDTDGFTQWNYQLYMEAKLHSKWTLRPYFRSARFAGRFDAGSYTDSKDEYNSTINSLGLRSTHRHANGSWILQAHQDHIHRRFNTSFGINDYEGLSTILETFVDYTFGQYKLVAGIDGRIQSIQDDMAQPIDPAHTIISPYAALHRRWSRWSVQVDNRYTAHPVFSKYTYGVSAAYDLLPERLKWRAAYNTGFKAPSLSQLYGQWGANKNLKPEYGKTLDVGIEFTAPDQTFQSGIHFFSRTIHNLIAYTTQYVNLDRQQDRGLELELKTKILNHWFASCNYTYVDGSFTTTTAQQKDTSYNNLLRRPAHLFNFYTAVDVSKKWNLQYGFRMQSSMSDLDFSSWPARSVQLNAFTVHYTNLQYRWDRHQVYLFVNNLFNKKFEEVYGYTNRPLSFKLGVSMNLGHTD